MAKTESRHRTPPPTKFAQIPNEVFENDNLSREARFLLAYILHLPPTWVFYPTHIRSKLKYGRDRYHALIGELRAAGYVDRMPIHGDGGKITGWEYEWFMFPNQDVANKVKMEVAATTALKNQTLVEPHSGEARLNSNTHEESNTNQERERGDGSLPPFSEKAQSQKSRAISPDLEPFVATVKERLRGVAHVGSAQRHIIEVAQTLFVHTKDVAVAERAFWKFMDKQVDAPMPFMAERLAGYLRKERARDREASK